MREVEAKFLEINVSRVQERLEELGAEKVLDAAVETWVFDFPDEQLHRSHRVLRLRRFGEKHVVTYKEPVSKEGAKVMDEYETVVSDPDAARAVITGLGLEQVMHHRKHRVSYTLGDTRFELDNYPEIPVFLEIEAPDKDTIHRYAERLGLDPADASSMSAYDLFRHYGKNPQGG